MGGQREVNGSKVKSPQMRQRERENDDEAEGREVKCKWI